MLRRRVTVQTAIEGDSLVLDTLNEPQAAAVAHVDGPLIVFAGAGSGKTRVITYRIANLVAVHNVPPWAVLAVTFTNKAAGEMRERLTGLLGTDVARGLWMGTFHSVCVRLLRRYHEEAGLGRNFVIYDSSDQKAVIKRVLKSLELDERRFAPMHVLGRIHKEKQEGRGPDDFDVSNYFDEVAQRCYFAYQAALEQANACDFEDLLLRVLHLAEDPTTEAGAHLRQRFRHVLVDEFQDVNLVQYRLVRAFAAERNICVVGDDDQSIYTWRGADIRNIRGFTRDYPDAKMVKLEQNYRSTSNVVGAALGVIRHARQRQAKELWTGNDAGDPVRIVFTANERDEALFVVNGVRDLIAKGTKREEIVVFYRVHAQSRLLEEAMRSANVPYQIVGGMKFFERAEVKDLLAYLRVAINPQSNVDLLRIINTPPRKIGAKSITQLGEIATEQGCCLYDAIVPLCASDRIGPAAKRSLRAFDEMMSGFSRAATTAPPHELAQEVLLESGYAAWLKKQDNAEADARMENLEEVLGAIQEYEDVQAEADEEASLADYLTQISLLSDADTMEEVPRVSMMTVHAAKGLEFDAVFITGMEERLFPLRGQEPGEEEQLEEERRLTYVAITRARKLLTISHANTRLIYGQTRYNTPSRFLGDIPRELTELLSTENVNAHRRELSRSTGSSGFGSPRTRPVAPPRNEEERYVDTEDPDLDFDDFDDVDFGDEAAELRVGGRVRHKRFGIGVVRAIGQGPDPVITVAFGEFDLRRIKLSFLAPA